MQITMFTVNIRGQRDTKNIEFVKLEMVFYKRGYACVTKVLFITGLYRNWDNKNQTFSIKDKESSDKNRQLREEKLKYLKVAERWESQGKDWVPVELSHFYDNDTKYRNRYIEVSQVIDVLAEKFATQQRYKNGRVLKSEPNARKYSYLKDSLEKFTRSKYRRDFSQYRFRDITEIFLL